MIIPTSSVSESSRRSEAALTCALISAMRPGQEEFISGRLHPCQHLESKCSRCILEWGALKLTNVHIKFFPDKGMDIEDVALFQKTTKGNRPKKLLVLRCICVVGRLKYLHAHSRLANLSQARLLENEGLRTPSRWPHRTEAVH